MINNLLFLLFAAWSAHAKSVWTTGMEIKRGIFGGSCSTECKHLEFWGLKKTRLIITAMCSLWCDLNTNTFLSDDHWKTVFFLFFRLFLFIQKHNIVCWLQEDVSLALSDCASPVVMVLIYKIPLMICFSQRVLLCFKIRLGHED